MSNQLEQVSMHIILSAGDARNNIKAAIDYLSNGDDENYHAEMKTAKENIREAHSSQTELIQSEAAGANITPNLLFIHAQDTLMTIMSEYNLVGNMFILNSSIEKRIRKLEENNAKD